MNEPGVLHFLSRVPKQAVVPRNDDFRCPFPRPDPQDLKLHRQPGRLSFGQLDVGVDSRDEGGDDLVSPRMIVIELAPDVAPESQQTRPDVG